MEGYREVNIWHMSSETGAPPVTIQLRDFRLWWLIIFCFDFAIITRIGGTQIMLVAPHLPAILSMSWNLTRFIMTVVSPKTAPTNTLEKPKIWNIGVVRIIVLLLPVFLQQMREWQKKTMWEWHVLWIYLLVKSKCIYI